MLHALATAPCFHNMPTKIKGIYKGFKFISHIFVKEREMEIGYPTDVKHVAHIGVDDPSGNAPSWMNEFKTPPNLTTTVGNPRHPNLAFSSQDLDGSGVDQSMPGLELPDAPKKPKTKKKTVTISSPKSSCSSTRSSRTKSKPKSYELEAPPNQQV